MKYALYAIAAWQVLGAAAIIHGAGKRGRTQGCAAVLVVAICVGIAVTLSFAAQQVRG